MSWTNVSQIPNRPCLQASRLPSVDSKCRSHGKLSVGHSPSHNASTRKQALCAAYVTIGRKLRSYTKPYRSIVPLSPISPATFARSHQSPTSQIYSRLPRTLNIQHCAQRPHLYCSPHLLTILQLLMAFNFLSRRTLKGEKNMLGTTLRSHLTVASFFRLLLRFFQFVLGITVIALYAQDLDNARKQGKYVDSKWVWAVVCGSLGAITALVGVVSVWFFCVVDFIVFLCYLVAFGIFGSMYISENPEGNSGITRMKNAVWVLLTNMLLWFITMVWGVVLFWKHRKARTSLTGRANMHV